MGKSQFQTDHPGTTWGRGGGRLLQPLEELDSFGLILCFIEGYREYLNWKIIKSSSSWTLLHGNEKTNDQKLKKKKWPSEVGQRLGFYWYLWTSGASCSLASLPLRIHNPLLFCPELSLISSRIPEGFRVSEVAQSCLTLCDPMDCSIPVSSTHGIFQARVLEWIAISFSRG